MTLKLPKMTSSGIFVVSRRICHRDFVSITNSSKKVYKLWLSCHTNIIAQHTKLYMGNFISGFQVYVSL